MQVKMDSTQMEKAMASLPQPNTIVVQQPAAVAGLSRSQARVKMCKIAALALVLCTLVMSSTYGYLHWMKHHSRPVQHVYQQPRYPVKPEHYQFYMAEKGKRVPAQAEVIPEKKIQHIKIPSIDGSEPTENLHDFEAGFTALKAVGKCFIQPLDKTLWRNTARNTDKKGEQVIQARHAQRQILPGLIHDQVLRFTAGHEIGDFCSGLPAQWLVHQAGQEGFLLMQPVHGSRRRRQSEGDGGDGDAATGNVTGTIEEEEEQEEEEEDGEGSGDAGDIGSGDEVGTSTSLPTPATQYCNQFAINICVPFLLNVCTQYGLVDNCPPFQQIPDDGQHGDRPDPDPTTDSGSGDDEDHDDDDDVGNNTGNNEDDDEDEDENEDEDEDEDEHKDEDDNNNMVTDEGSRGMQETTESRPTTGSGMRSTQQTNLPTTTTSQPVATTGDDPFLKFLEGLLRNG